MSRPALDHRSVFVSLILVSVAAAWWGCANATGGSTTETEAGTTTTTTTSSSTSSGSGTGGTGGVNPDGGGGSDDDGGPCVPTSAAAQRVPVDIVFLVDRSAGMAGAKWMTIQTALPAFFNDPASAGIGAGLLFLPYSPSDCNLADYESLVVPIAPLPGNAPALTSAIPASALGVGVPTYPALQGALMQATSYQDANPTHKVSVVLTTDSDPTVCDDAVADVATLAAGALSYDGVQTFVVGAPGASVTDLDTIAAAGGTTSAYDVTMDVTMFPGALDQIRSAAFGCDFEIPSPPGGAALNPADVNFSYTPTGSSMPTVLLRATDLASCDGQPGWYFDDNTSPTKITLCPASCSTVEDDTGAVVNVLFGCKSMFQ